MPQTPIIERAFALAASGECSSLDEVRRRLAQEGYPGLAAWFESRSFKRSLAALCRQARGGPAVAGLS